MDEKKFDGMSALEVRVLLMHYKYLIEDLTPEACRDSKVFLLYTIIDY